jgi:hypothetical protein
MLIVKNGAKHGTIGASFENVTKAFAKPELLRADGTDFIRIGLGRLTMTQRFGGKYSPNSAASSAAAPSVTMPPVRKMRLMFILPYLFVLSAFFSGTPSGLFLGITTFGLLTASAYLTREGLIAQAEYDARRIARPPKLPRKIFGALLMAAGLGAGAAMAGQPQVIMALFALFGAGLHLLAFGFDPLRAKGIEGMDQTQSDRVARAVQEAEDMLTAMHEAIERAADRALIVRVETFAHTARALFRSVEDDPRDLTAARKYLTVYLMGARDATLKFVTHYSQTRDAAARHEYEALLRDLETTFATRTRALIGNGRTGLDIEIQVLRERLKLES